MMGVVLLLGQAMPYTSVTRLFTAVPPRVMLCWVLLATKEYHTSRWLSSPAVAVAPAIVPLVVVQAAAGVRPVGAVHKSLAGAVVKLSVAVAGEVLPPLQ